MFLVLSKSKVRQFEKMRDADPQQGAPIEKVSSRRRKDEIQLQRFASFLCSGSRLPPATTQRLTLSLYRKPESASRKNGTSRSRTFRKDPPLFVLDNHNRLARKGA